MKLALVLAFILCSSVSMATDYRPIQGYDPIDCEIDPFWCDDPNVITLLEVKGWNDGLSFNGGFGVDSSTGDVWVNVYSRYHFNGHTSTDVKRVRPQGLSFTSNGDISVLNVVCATTRKERTFFGRVVQNVYTTGRCQFKTRKTIKRDSSGEIYYRSMSAIMVVN